MSTRRVVLAEYFATEDAILLFIVRPSSEQPEVVEIPTPLDELRGFVGANFGLRDVRQLDLDEWHARFGGLVQPILPYADEGDTIWFVPHDVLHYVPLHALKAEGRYLIERNPVCYAPSASVMKYCQAKRTGRRERALIVADSRSDLPLAHAREEALAIERLFAPQAEVLMGTVATKAQLRQRMAEAGGNIDILHVACHGYFHPDQALKSGIALAPEGAAQKEVQPRGALIDSPWNLTAEDIFGLEMHADLVTLSACQSGVNERKPGDELIGLTRSLIYAGTPSVVVSLWTVDDVSSSILMQTFYQSLRAGAAKAEALQQAQMRVKALTAEEAIALCREAKGHYSSETMAWIHDFLDEAIGVLRQRAGDFAGAGADYRSVKKRLAVGGPEARRIAVRIAQCELGQAAEASMDYQRRIYAHPYYWAPFVLVGDWK